MAESPWWYGVALFPLSPLLTLVSLGSLGAFVALSGTESGVFAGIATFVLAVLSTWLAVVAGVIVAVSAFMDARSLAGRETWSPNQYLVGGVGLVHLAGAELPFLYLLSVPALGFYIYGRRRRAP